MAVNVYNTSVTTDNLSRWGIHLELWGTSTLKAPLPEKWIWILFYGEA